MSGCGSAGRRALLLAWATTALLMLGACAALPDVSERRWDSAEARAWDSKLGQTAAASLTTADLSGFRLLASGPEALQARLELIDRAQVSIDLQAYQFKSDATGRRLMRALRDAAARGVHVRVLLDDLYTAGDDALWLGLTAHEGIELRLFNPFLAGRDSHLSRLTESAMGDARMHRRMHNKLLIADGVLAILGGRNIGDAYFAVGPPEHFIDIDVLVAGAVLPSLSLAFDLYWNSDHSHALHTVVEDTMPAAARRALFAEQVAAECTGLACAPAVSTAPTRPPVGQLQLAREFEQGRIAMHQAQANVGYDSPDKVESETVAADLGMLATSGAQVRLLVAQAVRRARYELWVVTPYLIPGPTGVAAIRDFHERGVRVVLLTNSLAATDEKTVHLGYRKYRGAVLDAGAELYEWSPARGGRVLREMLVGGTVLRLHTKAAIVDREMVFLGSMNFDPRSRDLNTEIGLMIHSPELAEQIRALTQQWAHEGSYRLRLDADGKTLRWHAGDSDELSPEFEPGTDFGSRFMLDLLEPLVPEELL